MRADTDRWPARRLERSEYPDSDGKPMADSGINAHRMKRSHSSLRRALKRRELQAYVENDIFVYPVEGNSKIRNAPDLFAAPGCAPFPPRRVFLCWEEPGPVAFAGEFLSITATEHLDSPRIAERVEFYRDRLATAELFLYEPLGEEFDSGFLFRFLRLDPAAGDYRETAPGARGWYHAGTLGLDLRPVDWGIEFRDPTTGELFPPVDDLDIHLRADGERQRAERAEAERDRAERRVRELEQRLRQLEQGSS